MTQLLNVSVSDGKYTVIQEADGRLHALRYGEPFNRSIVGDKLVLCLAQDLAQAREDLAEAWATNDRLQKFVATGRAPGAYTDPGPLTAAEWSVARWPTLRDAKGKTFAERKAEHSALLDQAKPATLEQAYEDAARMHSQMEADGTLRRAPLLDADFASLEERVLASYHAAYPNLQTLAKVLKETGKMSDEQFQQWLQRAAEHMRGSGTTARKLDTLRHSLRWVSTGEPCEAPASERTAPNFHAQADSLASIPPGTPLFDPDKAVATFRKEIDMAVGTLLAKLNTKV